MLHMQIDSAASAPSFKFCFHEFNSVTPMELGLWLMERPQLFCFSSRASEKTYKVLQVLLLMTYKMQKLFWVFNLGRGEKSGFCYALERTTRKIILKCLLNRKENKMKNVILTHSASLLHFLKCNGHGKELKHAFKKCLKAFFQAFLVMPKQS